MGGIPWTSAACKNCKKSKVRSQNVQDASGAAHLVPGTKGGSLSSKPFPSRLPEIQVKRGDQSKFKAEQTPGDYPKL
ncbi:uncharacterized protein N7484_003934 [Penicillium longicatenatum]|uniref:uncharacterized protein n=1 Tax=Penicillium longicatenatum TaxID=1561947 RepID=UPI002547BAB3|nr:uncharacterized protein N7484_003934 [Penicillium longicatenatum]KAJ5650211.1 hypothetical protein N7484_003934 [Penicillium longicatenatum]